MNELKIKHIVSFSSEDMKYPAENIAKPNSYSKWKCGHNERHASIVLQLEKASIIHGVDIGNCGSAFIEVLVGRSTWSNNEEFKVLLPASSFMSPKESKTKTQLTRVRLFGVESFDKSVCVERWDQIKIACAQPYDLNDTFGLSFVRLHAPPEVQNMEKPLQLGRFKLKSEPASISSEVFFQKRFDTLPASKPQTPTSTKALASRKPSIFPVSMPPLSTSQKNLRNGSPSSLPMADERRHDVVRSPQSSSRETKPDIQNAQKLKIVPKQKNESEAKAANLPPTKKPKVPMKRRQKRSFDKMLEGVTFVLSGYQNPERALIREMGMSMGASYSASWTNNCSHLVCAFRNTPKFNEVKGKGKIVSKQWFADCKRFKRRLKTKKYRMDGGGESSPEASESEEKEEEEDVEARNVSSENDTEDELDKIRDEQRVLIRDKQQKRTEKESDAEQSTSASLSKSCLTNHVPELPTFFKDKCFLFYGDMDERASRLLTRYITAYGGSIAGYMSDSVNYVVSYEMWDSKFKEALDENTTVVFVKPEWVLDCHEQQRFLHPRDDYVIGP